MYQPCILFRAKCFAKTPFHVIYREHYEALFPKTYKREQDAVNYAAKQIEHDSDIWQLPVAKLIKE